MNFNDLLKRYNRGILRGAARKLARSIGVEESSVSRWRRGGPIAEELQERVAIELGVSLPQLLASLGRKESAPSGVDMATMTKVYSFVPVLGPVAADRFSVCFDAVAEEHIPNPFQGKKVFALRVSGDCMEPTFRDGEYIYLSETQPVANGKIVLAQLDGEFTLKRYFKRADGIELVPDNKRYRPIKISSNKLTIRGVVVGTYRKDI